MHLKKTVESPFALVDIEIDGDRPWDITGHDDRLDRGVITRDDVAETKAFQEVPGQRADDVPDSAPKSMFGHSLGASGAIRPVATSMAIHDGRVHPTINLENPAPECDLDQGPSLARRVAMSNHFAFGEPNTVLIQGRNS